MSSKKLPQLHLLGELFRQDGHSEAGFVVVRRRGSKSARLQALSFAAVGLIIALLPSYLATSQPVIATSGVNNTINVQGKVTNSNGTNVTDGLYDMVFKLYNGADGTATNTYTESWTSATLFSQAAASVTVGGSNTTITYSSDTNESSLKPGQFLWDATKVEAAKIVSVNTSGTGGSIVISTPQQTWAASDTITNRIYVKDGIFQVALNSLNQDANWGTTDFTQDTIYLGVNFNSDGEMKPRSQFSGVPYAFRAKSAATVDGLTIASGKTLTVNNTISFSGTDSTSFTLPSASDTLVGLAASQALTNKTVNGLNITSTTGTLTIASGKTLTANNSVSLSGTDGIAVNFGGNNLTLTTSGATSLTLPTSGTVCVTSTGCNQTNTNTGSGSAGQLTYYTGTNTQAGSNNLFWATGTSRLGINTAANPGATLDVSSGETTANAAQINANSLTTGLGLSIASTSTTMTTGGLLGLSWTPGSATTMTGDLFSINVGPNGTVGNILNLMNDGLSVFSVSQNLITANVPVAFNAPGDFNLANGLYFSNTTQANISSAAPIQITSGEAFNSSNLTLSTYNSGMVVLDTATTTTNGKVGIGTSSPTGQLHIKGTLSTALSGTIAVTNASAAVVGTSTSFTTALNAGDAIGISGVAYTVSSITDATHLTLAANYAGTTASGLTAYSDGTALAIDNGAGTNNLTFTKSGRLGIGTNAPTQALTVVGNALISGNSNKLYLADGAHYLSYDGSNLQVQSAAGGININTSTAAPITFGINNGEQMRIDTTGNVGIGTSTGINSKLTFAASTTASGGILFGSDTNLYRAGANSLQTDGLLVSGVGLTAGSSAYATRASGDTNSRFYILNTGGMNWGPGNAATDTNLYRASAGVLKTDTAFQASTINGLSITNNGTNTLNIAAGKTLTVSNTLTMTGTDGSSVNFGSGGTVCYTSSGCNAANTNTGSGTAGQVTFYTGTNTQSSDSNLVWDNTNKRLGIGATPLSKLDVNGGVAIGSYAGTAAAPSNGLIVSGQVGIGTNSPSANLTVAGTTPTVTGSELITNGTFNTDASGWTLPDCGSWVSGHVSVTYTSCSNAYVSTNVSVTSGNTYKMTFDVTATGDSVQYYMNFESNHGGPYSTGTQTVYWTASYTGTETIYFDLWNYNSGANYTLDNVSLKQTSSPTPSLIVNNAAGATVLRLGADVNSNVGLGVSALNSSVTGVDNIAFGSLALQSITNGMRNTALGVSSLSSLTNGASNVGVGAQSLRNVTTGSSNVAIGVYAGRSITNGNGNVFIGALAGYNETGSNKLYIANSSTSSPLIYGDFSAGSLTFNGNVTLGSGKTIQGLSITNNGTNTLNIAAGKTLTANSSLTLAGADSKTLTINNTITFGGTDSTSFTLPGANDTLAGIAAAQTLTNKTIGSTGITYAGATSPGLSAAGTGKIYYDSATNRFMASENGGAYINLLGGYNKTITLSAEYAGATLTADGSSTTNGAMTSDSDSTNGYMNYYQWTSTQAALQDYTVAVRVTLPQDFGSWQSTGVSLNYKTGTATATDNAIDLTLTNTSGSAIYSTTGLNNTNWTALNIASGSLTGATPWNSAGATAVFRIKLKADSAASAKAMVGDITINYVSKF